MFPQYKYTISHPSLNLAKKKKFKISGFHNAENPPQKFVHFTVYYV